MAKIGQKALLEPWFFVRIFRVKE